MNNPNAPKRYAVSAINQAVSHPLQIKIEITEGVITLQNRYLLGGHKVLTSSSVGLTKDDACKLAKALFALADQLADEADAARWSVPSPLQEARPHG